MGQMDAHRLALVAKQLAEALLEEVADGPRECDLHGEFEGPRCPECLKDEERHNKAEAKRLKAQRKEEALSLKALDEQEMRVKCHHCGHEQDHVGTGSPVCENKECVTRDKNSPLLGCHAFQEIAT